MDPRDYLCNKSPLATESQRIVLLLHVNWLVSKIFVLLLKDEHIINSTSSKLSLLDF